MVPTLGYLLSTLGLDALRPHLGQPASSTTDGHRIGEQLALPVYVTTAASVHSSDTTNVECKQKSGARIGGRDILSQDELYDSDTDVSAADTDAAAVTSSSSCRVLRQRSSDSYLGPSVYIGQPSSRLSAQPRAPLGAVQAHLARHPNPMPSLRTRIRAAPSSLLQAAITNNKIPDDALRYSANIEDGVRRNKENVQICNENSLPVVNSMTPRAVGIPNDESTLQDGEAPKKHNRPYRLYRQTLPSKTAIVAGGIGGEDEGAYADSAPLLLPLSRPGRALSSDDISMTQARRQGGMQSSSKDTSSTGIFSGLRSHFASSSQRRTGGGDIYHAAQFDDAPSIAGDTRTHMVVEELVLYPADCSATAIASTSSPLDNV